MKKTNFIIFLTFIMFLGIVNVNAKIDANYNGTGNPGQPSHAACPTSTSPSNLCVWNNGNHATIRVTLVKYKDGKRAQLGHAIYYTNSNYPIDNVGVMKLNGTTTTESTDSYIQTVNFHNSGNNISWSKLESYYVSKDGYLKKGPINTIKDMDVPNEAKFFGSQKILEAHLLDNKK